jgi:tetratricopeptide (TPR) repeat protein
MCYWRKFLQSATWPGAAAMLGCAMATAQAPPRPSNSSGDEHVIAAKAAEARGDFNAAVAELKQALERWPDDASIRKNLGLAYYRSGDLAHARHELERVHQERPEDVDAAVLLGFTYNKMGRAEETIPLLKPLEAANSSNQLLEYALAFAEVQSGNTAEGAAKMEQVARTRKTADAWIIAGRARFALGHFAMASNDAEEAIKIDANYPGLRTLAGQAHYAVGQRPEAAVDFQQALRLEPRDFTANLYLGMLKFDDRDLDDAKPLLELALSLQPNHPLTRLELGRLKNLEGDTQGALELLESLEKSDPQWIDPHIDLAAIYYKLHRPEDGKRERALVDKLESEQHESNQQR